ncbi:hypothetical protein BY996DRAFT_8405651 [Phakopsora pachyrhizi]|nr:hypothetical protein BY996DRAFT_8405651 [Phakopsora pachyrhizi]
MWKMPVLNNRLAGSDYSGDTKASISLESLDYVAFHGPYGKLEIEKTFMKLSLEIYKQKVEPTTQCMKRLGNMYKASLYQGLASFIDSEGSKDGLGFLATGVD